MFIKMLKSKIHRARVTDKNVGYSGSISIDAALLAKAGLREFEQVLVANVATGTRHETYVQAAPAGSGAVVMNGAAARLGEVGDLVIIMGFAYVAPEEADAVRPRVVQVDARNRFTGYLSRARARQAALKPRAARRANNKKK
jgi:aspartate 1-decarboxylase